VSGRVRHVLVAGGGIGGLAVSIALRQRGFRVTVLERSAAAGERSSAALGVQTNAALALRELGVADAVLSAGVPVEEYVLRSWRGRELARWSPGAVGRELGAPNVTVPRQVVLDALRAAVPERDLRLGAAVDGVVEHPERVVVRLADGSELDGDLLVGADGVNSTVRARLLGEEEPPRYAGYTAWRGVAAASTPSLRAGGAAHLFGVGRTFGMWPLPGGRTYWVATRVVPAATGTAAAGAGEHERLRAEFAGAAEPVPYLLDRSDPAGVLRTPIFDRGPVSRWHGDRVVLLGDAAHPMQPTTGQGAGQALLDALALPTALSTVDWAVPGSVRDGLARYAASRTGAVAVAAEARQIGGMQHVPNRAAALVRDLVLRATPASVWQRRAANRLDELDLLREVRAGRTSEGAQVWIDTQ
jgi:2-polyprenyl-6-methoxyphenol hydroxylase-like FAD-dependent oxidoreductase